MKKYRVHIIWLVVAIVAFAGGTYFSKMTAASGGRNAFVPGNMRTFAGRSGVGSGAGGGFAAGKVLSKDAQSITVQLPNGSSEVVFYSTSTQVIKPSPASMDDLVPGTNVLVGGAQNSDGSVTAQTIQIRDNSTSFR